MAARRDGSAIKMNHVSANRSQRARCVVTAFSYATLRTAVVKVRKSRLDVYAPIGRKNLRRICVFAHLSKQIIEMLTR